MMNTPQIAALIAVFCNLALTFFVFSRDVRSVMSWVFFFWGMSMTIWNLGAAFLFQATEAGYARYFAYVLQFGVIFLPVANLHLCLLVARISIGRLLPLFYGLHFLVAISLFTGHFIKGVRWVDNFGYYSIPGPFFWVFLVLYIISTNSTMIFLNRQRRSLPLPHRARLSSLMLALGILILFGTNDLLPMFMDHYPFPFHHFKLYPFGNVGAVFYVVIISYSVLQHKLMDIHVVLSRLAAQVVRLAFIMVVGSALLFLVTRVAPAEFNYVSYFSALAVFLVTAIIASMIFPRLFGKGEETLERRFLRDRFEYQDKIQEFIQSLPWYTDTMLLMDDFHDLLAKIVKVRRYYIVLLNETTRRFSLFRSFPDTQPGEIAELERDSPIFHYFHTTKVDYLALNPVYGAEDKADLDRKARRQLKQFNAEFCYPFWSDDDPIGLLLIGEKSSEEPYTPHDLQLLTAIVKNLSLIINQIRLKQRVLVTEEMELLGRMSRGMAHDLNNLITPIWTYLQLARENIRPADSSSELLPSVTRNVETIQTYIRESLFYSNTLTPYFVGGRLDAIVHKTMEVVEPQLREKNIGIKCVDLPRVELEMDSVLIQRMLTNLLRNAGDASPAGSEVEVQLSPLTKTETNRDWFRLQIIDHGSGISRQNLPHVFRPYFTTKDRGSERRGFGLGLAICRKIVLLHEGNLSITSEEKKGTTVIVDLPTRRAKVDAVRNPPVVAQAGFA